MKNLYLRSCIALLCTVGVVACGGGGNLQLGGTVTGLTKSGLALSNNGGTPFVVALRPGVPTFTFAFPSLVNTDSNYNVIVSSQPTGANCVIRTVSGISSGTGRATSNVVSVFVDCTTESHTLSGAVTGLAAGSTLINGDTQTTVTNNLRYAFEGDNKINDGDTYGIVVQGCTVNGGVGTMGTQDVVADITVTNCSTR
jgi:hypothetical protein